ncbi:hypothetical protein F0L74_01775 [Chitinophaga agrisoli]|uniref:Uncharacterized protein n=1 Tax=Chitinophaga agrisoli TaxID=2607653 RepID=A0A5B2W1E4_9BACT|nr:hypothetical protein [Chitinophaga agrisoli]KAA2244728.1 hypothetical protein F0L74_01775 [Chitinophaga agrisoli]
MTLVPEPYLQVTARELGETMELHLPDTVSYEQLEDMLAQRLEILISEHFQQFVFLLYRIDVREDKIREILEKDAGEGAYHKIAALLIERQLEKIRSREMYRSTPPENDEEKW